MCKIVVRYLKDIVENRYSKFTDISGQLS